MGERYQISVRFTPDSGYTPVGHRGDRKEAYALAREWAANHYMALVTTEDDERIEFRRDGSM